MATTETVEREQDEDEYDPLEPYDAACRFNVGRPMKIQRGEFFGLTQAHMKEAADEIQDEPPWNGIETREEHNREQRQILMELCRKVAENKDIPMQLFDPPEHYVQVVFLEEENHKKGWYCPCCNNSFQCEYFEIKVPSESEEGITTDMLLRKVSEALYGKDDDGSGWHVGTMDERPVLRAFGIMMNAKGRLTGNIYAYLRGIRRGHTDEERKDNHTLINLS